jgi:DNA modification methylase
MGSGTTGVACAQYGREFVGIELEEKYFNIACRRIEEAYQQADMFINRSEPFSNALHHPEYVSKFL